jgi:glycosyltransferase involved in cell wall biosynthesis
MNYPIDISLSVLIPVHKIDIFFESAIQSMADQTFKNFEVIFLVDSTIAVNFDLALKDSKSARTLSYKCVYLSLKGLSYALNRGIEESSCHFIARMDADDVSSPKRFERQINFLINNDDISVVGCRVGLIDESGNKVFGKKFRYYENNNQIVSALYYRNPLCHPALIFRKEVLINVGGYTHGGYSEDHELFLRIARLKKYKFANLNEELFYYRRHSSQSTNISNSYYAFFDISGFLFSEFLRTRNWRCILGMFAIYPPIRRARNFIARFRV